MFGSSNSTGFSFGQPQQQQQQPTFGFGAAQQPQPQQSGAGMFGSTATSAFGSNTGFGQQQQKPPAFGQPQTSTGLGGFNVGATTNAFGGGGLMGSNTNQPTSAAANNGTGNPPWAVTVEREQAAISVLSNYQAISAMPAYKTWSIEELRAQDYLLNKKFASSQQQQTSTGAFGTSTSTTAGFGAPSTTSTFGQPAAQTGGLFGAQPAQSAFGGGAFGAAAPAANTGFGGAFGAKPFGTTTTAPTTFGAAPTSTFGAPATSTFGQPAPTTSAFGQPTAATGFGQPAVPTATAGGGLFGQQKPGGLFGSQPAAAPAQASTGLFGQQPQQTTGFGFGQPAPAQAPAPATSAFSGFGQSANQPKPTVSSFGQPQAASGGLFGKPAAAPGLAPSMFGTASQQSTAFGGSAFGTQQPQQQQPATSLFGQPQGQQPQPAGGLFGAAATSQPSTTAPSTGLFGGTNALKPAAPGGLFGGTTGGLGATGLGAAAPSTTTQSAFSFGAAPAATAAPTFAQTQQQPAGTTSLFQSATAGGGTSLFAGFGGTAGTTSVGPGGSLFGGSFGSQTAQAQPQQPLQAQGPVLHASLNKNPYGINPLLQKSPSQQQTAGATDNGPVNATPGPSITSKTEKKLPILTPAFKVTPRSTSQIKLRGIAPVTVGPTLAESHRNQIGISSSATGVNGNSIGGKKSLHVLDGSPRDVVALGLDSRFTPRRSVKRLDIDDASIFLSSGTPSKAPGTSRVEAGSKVSFDPTLEDAAAALISNTAGGSVGSTPAASSRNSSPSPPRNAFRSVSPGSAPSNTATSYIMTPSIDQLLRLSDVELSNLSNFSISVPLYGSVSFLEPVDLLSASPTNTRAGIQDIPGNVVLITSQLVTVYPDDTVKHPRGQGLNVPAVISLASCFPKDRKTGDIIDNESDPRFDKHLKKLRQMPDTTFIGFEVVSGTWKFKVEHFSKYGLLDSDESDDENIVAQTVPETPGIYKKSPKVQFQDDQDEESDEGLIDDTFIVQSGGKKWTSILKPQVISKTPLKSVFQQSPLSREIIEDSEQEEEEEEEEEEEYMTGSQEEDIESEDIENESVEESESESLISGEESEEDSVDEQIIDEPPKNTINAAMATVERIQLARNVQTMKATLFPSSPVASLPKAVLPQKPVTFSLKDSPKREALSDNDDAMVPGVVSRTEFASLPVSVGSPQKYARQDRLLISKVDLTKAVPYEQSLTYGKHKSGALDAAFFMGRSFRAGFGPFGTLTCLKSTTHISVKSISSFNESAKSNQTMLQNSTLECVLENTNIFQTVLADDGTGEEIQVDPSAETGMNLSEGCPKSSLSMDFSFSKLVGVSSSLGFSDAEIDIWKLCSALWDRLELDINDLSGFEDEQLKAIENGLRKSKFSEWLHESCHNSVEQDLAKATNDIDRIFILLSGNKLSNAIKTCLSSRNYHLATILSQLPTPLSITTPTGVLSPKGCPGRNGLAEEVQKDLISQIGEWSKSTFKDNPKKMAIWALISGGVHLWDEDVLPRTFDWKRIFGLFFWFSAGGFLSMAEAVEQYTSNFDVVVKPTSQWSNNEFDLKYHLIQIFSSHDWELETALNPYTHCSSPLDYRISWLLGMLLTKVFSVSQFKDSQAFAVEKEDDPMQIDEEDVVVTSKTQDVQLLHYISQLESLELWKWAIFVSSFLSNHTNRECTIRGLLNRWYPLEDDSGSFLSSSSISLSETYTFLTKTLHVPSLWIYEAKALKARYQHNLYLEIAYLLDAKKYQIAEDLLISLYAPSLIISGDLQPLFKLLSQFPENINQEIEWNRKGKILKTYVDLKLKYLEGSASFSSLTETDREELTELVDAVLKDLSEADLYLSWALGAGTRKDALVEENIDIGRLCLLSVTQNVRAQSVRMAAMHIL